MGALSFSDKEKPPVPSEGTSILQLSELVKAAEKFERGDVLDSELTLLFAAGSSPGGARPKAVVYDDAQDGHYLAKFPSVKDREDVVRIEAATMILAEQAGLVVPATRIVECEGKSILLVERFDVISGGGRRHMLSFQTLLKAEGFYQLRYEDLLGIVRKYSDDPQDDSVRLYRQMVFNAVVGNTDDHLKNFWMIYERGHGWRLSPAFDLIPDVGRRGEHVLFFDLGAYFPGRRKLEQLGRKWGIHKPEEVVAQVFDAMARWKEVFAGTGVPEDRINLFGSATFQIFP
jgi:serine/threonine-protein kinase HipA